MFYLETQPRANIFIWQRLYFDCDVFRCLPGTSIEGFGEHLWARACVWKSFVNCKVGERKEQSLSFISTLSRSRIWLSFKNNRLPSLSIFWEFCFAIIKKGPCFYLFGLHIFLKRVCIDFSNIERKFPIWLLPMFLGLWYSFLIIMTAMQRHRKRKEHVYDQPGELGFKVKTSHSTLLISRPWGQVPLMGRLLHTRRYCVFYIEYLNY